MRLRIVGFLIAFATFGAAAAHAEQAFTMADVNLRTGPDVEFPSVDVILEGEPVDIKGCLRDESWCDVSWYGGRGWVFSEYLAVEDDGQIVPLLDVGLVEFSIPYVSFAVADYWGRYYVGRPWYRERDRWFSYRIRARSGWQGPPRGPRRPGWWRSGYHAPSGMRPPPSGAWRRPIHHGPRDLRDRNERNDRGNWGPRRDDRGDRGDRDQPREDADTTLATAPLTAEKCSAVVVNMESGAVKEAMTEAAATGGVEVSSPIRGERAEVSESRNSNIQPEARFDVRRHGPISDYSSLPGNLTLRR